MKIANSSIAMASGHHEKSYSYKESMTIEAAKSQDVAGAILTLSKEESGMNLKESMVEFKKQQEEEFKNRQQENQANSLKQMAEMMRANNKENQYEIPDDLDMKIKMLRQMLAALRGEKLPEDLKNMSAKKRNVCDLRSASFREKEATSFSLSTEGVARLGTLQRGTNAFGTTWQKITATSGFSTELESTSFASKGVVQTEDGRNIDFNIEFSMSRASMSYFDSLEVKEYIKTDPLIINMDSNITSVSNQKFFFDLNTDGKEEEISFAGKGSGFLALDKNNDGKINDGSELFGTKSGDGFKDLSAYDDDKNGWIDENDDVFSKLKIWTKDEDGNDYLIDLRKADVGAIYLGNADTQYSLKNEGVLNAEIKKTGIYLKESSGMAGTLSHVDLVL